MQIAPPRFCHVLTPDCVHYNAVKIYKPHYSNSVFTISQKYIFSVHQITTSGRKFTVFLARTRTKYTAQNAPKRATSSEKLNLLWGSPPAHWERIPPPSPQQALWIHPASPRIPARFTPLGTTVTSTVTTITTLSQHLHLSGIFTVYLLTVRREIDLFRQFGDVHFEPFLNIIQNSCVRLI